MASKKLQNIISDDKKYLFQNYGDRLPVCFIKGDGSYLFDQDNKKYVDFFSGIAVNSLGYNNKNLSKNLHNQVSKIIHSSNWFFNKEQITAAKLLSELSFTGKTLFVNSGAEANEAALKLARKYGQSVSPDKFRIISFAGSFHGRTFGSLSATAQEKIRKGFGPILKGFTYCDNNSINSFKKAISKDDNTCAVIIELVQGESGINIADKSFVNELFSICKEKKIITIVDEVQTGIGRTGKPFAYQHFNIEPDIITLAKGLGGGVPIGAIHARDNLAQLFTRGTHGTTFGGNHLASSAAVAVLTELRKPALLKNVMKNSAYIINRLEHIRKKVNFINEIRGIGFHIGIELNKNGMEIVKKALLRGLVINCTVDKVIRIMPPLNISGKLVTEGMNILDQIFMEEG